MPTLDRTMHIESIQLVNYRCHENLEVRFNDRFNVIAAVNGGGKTSLLRAVATALGSLLQHAGVMSGAPLSPGVARVETHANGGRYRFEQVYPVEVTTQLSSGGQSTRWTVQLANGVSNPSVPAAHSVYTLAQSLTHAGAERALPMVAFYPAARSWPVGQPSHLQAAMTQNSRKDGYDMWWEAAQSASLPLWLIAKCLERTQIAAESGARFDEVEDDELSAVNLALRAIMENFHAVKFDMKRSSLLAEWTDGRPPTAFDDFSDGQRAVIFLVSDLVRRACLLNPQLGTEVLQKTPGVVLIDELDIHLHPQWQRLLVRGLKNAFPRVQFITASHSPQIIGELQPDEILLLGRGEVAQPQVSYGLTSSEVLTYIMGAEARTTDVDERLEQVLGLIERGSLEQARVELSALDALAHGVPELEYARAALARQEIIGR